ncbi:MAG: hypothetical protein QNK23_09205 [Crocinitomicaceae bacterium]|nr:hypothetical protein [Crocinitomicaceae bacterium]
MRAVMPDGPVIFASSIFTNEPLQDIVAREQRKVDIINTVYFPLCRLEEFYWGLR